MTDISMTGTAGTNGANGSGSSSGGLGGTGQAVTADNTGNGSATTNTAEATGGAGGNGGNAGPTGRHAGSGGSGGSATAGVAFSLASSSTLTGGATATGGAGGSSGAPAIGSTSVAGLGGAGGGATASGSVTNTSGAVDVTARATGGYGGSCHGYLGAGYVGAGGAGGVASGVTAYGHGQSVDVRARQTGGAGGFGFDSANGGAGASSTLTNAVSGKTTGGRMTLGQSATGGAGGIADTSPINGVAGAAGAGASSLTVSDTTASTLIGYSGGYGGQGGGGLRGGKSGGAGTAAIALTGANAVNAVATATGGAGGAFNAGGAGGAGGAATASASASSTAASQTATAQVTATGGKGGVAFGSAGGGGGAASVGMTTASGFNAFAKAIQSGGAGGYGANSSDGAGAGSVIINEVGGSTTGGSLYLGQEAIGGAGGVYKSTAGAGGLATSSLTFNDVAANTTHAASLTGLSAAYGGAGATGGAATATINLTGANHVVVISNALGGAGAGTASVGGTATATAEAAATSSDAINGVATATADAASGNGATVGTANATAQATTAAGQQAQAAAVLTGASGQEQATAISSHGLIVTSLSSEAQAAFTVYNGQVQADTNAVNPYGFAGGGNAAYAAGTIDPSGTFVTNTFTANSNIAAASAPGAISGLGASFSAVFGAATEGMFVPNGTSGSHTFTSTEDFTLDSAIISGHLIVGLAGTTVTGGTSDTGDFSNLAFTVTVNGAVTATDSFSSLAAAQAFFSNTAVDAGGFSSSQPLDVQVTLSVTSATPNFGFADQFVLGATDGFAPPVVSAPATVLIQQGQAGAISGVSVSEATGLTGGQSVTVELTDANGLLSQTAGQGTITGNGGADLTLTGTVGQVNADLATLSDTDATAGSDTITVTSSDGRTGVGTPATIAVTVHGIPVIAVPGPQTIGVGTAATIGGVSVSETGATGSPETFSAAVSDTSGVLSATGFSAAGTSITVSGVSLNTLNTDLASLSDTDGVAGSDTITVSATDSFGNAAAAKTVAVTTNGAPVIAVPGTQTIGLGTAATIGGVSVSETGNSGSPETFSATVSDTNGVLTATGFSAAGTSITVSGVSLNTLNTDLASLSDTDGVAGSDTITVSATDSFGNTAAAKTVAVTVNGAPAIAVPGVQTIGIGAAATIGGVSVTETGNTGSPETFSATVSDTNGVLSATGFSAAGTSITITGVSLSDLNQDLASLTDTNATAGDDTITVSATDSFGAAAANQSIAVTTNGLPAVAVPGAQTIGVGTAATIGGVMVSETGNTGSPETFSATVSDAAGVLSATGFSAAGASITLSGVSLNTLNTDLASLSDTDGMAGSDTITVNATDSFGAAAAAKTIAVTVNDLPAVAVPGPQTLGVGVAATIGGVVVSETGNTGWPETFSATLSDANGVLSATGFSAAGTSITVSGVSLNTLNDELTSLSDTDGVAGSDTITVHATDSFGNAATAMTVAVTVNGLPVIAVPGAKTIAVGKAAGIAGVSVSETGNTAAPETFSATVSDTNGVLSATGFSAAGTSITVSGVSLATLNTDLASLSDTDGTAGTDTITVHATDSFGAAAAAKTVTVTVNGLPAVAAPASVTIADVQPNAISGVSLSESGSTTGELFTATLTDASGLLSATGAGITGSGTTSLTIANSIAAVNADLATLKDTEAATGADTITLGATDGFGAAAANKTIAVTTTSNIHWTSQVSGNFPNSNDWTPHVAPGATDAAILDAPGSTAYIVIASTNETVPSVQTASTARLAITGGVFTITNGTGSGSNAGQVSVTQNATLDIGGVFANAKVFYVENNGAIEVAAGGLTLTGSGSVYLADNTLEGATSGATLTTSNFLYGAGQLGGGRMILVNQAAGIIESYGSSPLTIDTGANTITNAGLILATSAGGMTIASAVANTGHFAVNGGSMTVIGAVTGAGYAEVVRGTLDFAGAFNENVVFTAGSTGTLELADSIGYTGRIQGLSTTGANALDLADITFTSGVTTATFSGSTSSGVLTVTDGTHTAKINLIGDYVGHTFTTSLGAGGVGTRIVDPPAGGSSTISPLAPPPHAFIAAMAALGAETGGSASWTHDPQQFARATLFVPRTHAA